MLIFVFWYFLVRSSAKNVENLSRRMQGHNAVMRQATRICMLWKPSPLLSLFSLLEVLGELAIKPTQYSDGFALKFVELHCTNVFWQIFRPLLCLTAGVPALTVSVLALTAIARAISVPTASALALTVTAPRTPSVLWFGKKKKTFGLGRKKKNCHALGQCSCGGFALATCCALLQVQGCYLYLGLPVLVLAKHIGYSCPICPNIQDHQIRRSPWWNLGSLSANAYQGHVV